MNCTHHILTAQQMQAADKLTMACGTTGLDLMEKAGKAIVPACHQHKIDAGRIVIITGQGNNGGDGFVAARILRENYIPVTVIPLFALESLRGDAATQAKRAKDAGVKIRPATSPQDLPALQAWLKRAVIIVDAIFGIGLSRPVEGWLAQVIDAINAMDRPVLSVDMPSGVHADSGNILGTAIQATATLPIAAYKWGHWVQPGNKHSGKLLAPANIGIDDAIMQQVQQQYPAAANRGALIDSACIRQAFPKRPLAAYKQTSGHVWIFGGSVGYTGAPKLAAMGAQAVGAGLVSIACPQEVFPIIAAHALEVMVHPQTQTPWQPAHAMVAGPGWGMRHHDLLKQLIAYDTPLVLDADALNMIANDNALGKTLKQRQALSVITPHPGEAARLLHISTTEVQQDRLNAATQLATKYHAWVVLKGARTLIASPQKDVWVCPFGSPNLATAGTGDVLAGMLAGLLANQAANAASPDICITAAVALHARVGEQPSWYRAGQLPQYIHAYIQALQHPMSC